jgi:hypothetical protein
LALIFVATLTPNCANDAADTSGADDDGGLPDDDAGLVNPGQGSDAGPPPGKDGGKDGGYDSGSTDSGGPPDSSPPPDASNNDSGQTCSGAGQILCNGACIDGQNDSNNCGACGHSCQGACSQGACTAVVLSSQFTPLGGIAQDANTIYFVGGDGTLKSVPKVGGATTTIASGLASPIGVTLDATNAYVTEQGANQVTTIALAGGAKSPLATGQGQPTAITTDGTYVYWMTYGSGALNGTVMRCANAGCGNAPTLLAGQIYFAPPQSYGPVTGIAVDSASVYFGNNANGGELRKVPLAGGVSQQLVGSLGIPMGISLTGTTVAVATLGASGQILAASTSGGSTLLAGSQPFAVSAATTTTDVYWTFYNPQSINGAQVMKCPLAGCSNKPQVMARNIQPAEGIVADGTSIYWLSNDGTVLKTPR